MISLGYKKGQKIYGRLKSSLKVKCESIKSSPIFMSININSANLQMFLAANLCRKFLSIFNSSKNLGYQFFILHQQLFSPISDEFVYL
jgi:hypothetical protein